MHRAKRLLAAAALVALIGAVAVRQANAQAVEGAQTTKYLELLRQDLRTQKTAIVTEAMDLTDAQAEVFWPMYDEYSLELRRIWDGRIANIKDFAENYERMTNDKARQLADRSFRLEDDKDKLLKKYYGRMVKQLDPMVAARFVQVESAVYNLVSLQLSAELPLMK